jgi:hypothetical protein
MPSAKSAEVLSDQELSARIATLLGKWPLYRTLKFQNDSLDNYPEIVRTHCPTCGGERNFDQISWEGMKSKRRAQGPFGPEQIDTARRALRTLSYRCPDCKRYWVSYLVFWEESATGQENVIQKCGQYPEIETVLDSDLEKSISPQDTLLLKKAVRARSFNFGLAAVAYLRRVVENQIEPLIERLLKDRKGSSDKLLARVKKARSDRGFRKLLEIAGGILPDYLKPQGQNPLVHLYGLASEGLHNLPEEECIDIFDESIVVFSFVFSALRRHQTEAKVYAENLNNLVKNEKTHKTSSNPINP